MSEIGSTWGLPLGPLFPSQMTEEERRKHWAADTKPATPPTPDLDAVVTRVRANLCEMTLRCDWGDHTIDPSDIRALLAAVSRPAEARGEAVLRVGGVKIVEDPRVPRDQAWYFNEDGVRVGTITGIAAPRPEPEEPSEAMVEAFIAAFHDTDKSRMDYRMDVYTALCAALAVCNSEQND